MSAKLNLREQLKKDMEEFGIDLTTPDFEIARGVLSDKANLELEIAEQVKEILRDSDGEGNVVLGFYDGSVDRADNFRWEIQQKFLEFLQDQKIIINSEATAIWDEISSSHYAAKSITVDEYKEAALQKIINDLGLESKKAGTVLLTEGDVYYDKKSRTMSFLNKSFEFEDDKRTLDFLNYMMDPSINVNEEVSWKILYKVIFGCEPDYRIDVSLSKTPSYIALKSAKDHINRRVRREFCTTNQLFRMQAPSVYRCF